MDISAIADQLTPDPAETRNRAFGRAWLCPGAGFALVGRRRLAAATFLTTIVSMAGVTWLCLAPNPLVGWTSVPLLAVAALLWIAEVILVRFGGLRAAGPAFLVRRHRLAAILVWVCGFGAAYAFYVSVGKLEVPGKGMNPTIMPYEQVVYHTRVRPEDLTAGRVIAFRVSEKAAGNAGKVMVATIVAGPGDRISRAREWDRYVVNGEPSPFRRTGLPPSAARIAIQVPSEPKSLTVPEGCYFVIEPSRFEGCVDSEYVSWVERKDVMSARMWYLREKQFFHRVE